MDDSERERIRAKILRRLLRLRKVGGAHTESRNAIKGLPPELLGQAKDELKWPIKQNYLLHKPSTGEVHVSINPRMLKEVHELLRKHLEAE